MKIFFTIKSFLLLCSLFVCVSLFAQKKKLPYRQKTPVPGGPSFICGTDELRLRFNNDTAHIVAENMMNAAILRHAQQQRTDTTNITLPVVFHIVGDVSPFVDSQMVAAVANLNAAFGKTGKYSPSVGVDTHIRFCMAQTDPNGGVTNGITHTTHFFGQHLNPLTEDAKLKELIIWDPAHYINIWVVSSMELEAYPVFQCNNWIRIRPTGYSTMPPASSQTDGIVVSELGLVLVEQMGHYLGLYHTFEGFNCKNSDCTTDGDKVCDTPPDANIYNSPSCSSPTNSCKTDTLSGYTVDVPDQIDNFMDNGNTSCRNEFTAGQRQRMTATINTQRAGLLVNKCNPPCNQNIVASFLQSITYPVLGDNIVFTNTSTGATAYQWFMDGVLQSTSPVFAHTFPTAGIYKITLKAIKTASCFSTMSVNVVITCGVTARFYTLKRQIAAKAPKYLDSIKFINNSVNATSFKWYIKNDNGLAEQLAATTTDFTYTFTTPATYSVRLIAKNGSCIDTTEYFTVPVLDPEPDGRIVFNSADCYLNTKVKISFYVCNGGYDIIPPNIPMTFYDTNPLLPYAKKLGTTIYTTDTILGRCCSALYSTIVDVGYRGLNNLYIAFNDNGTTHPLTLPNTSFTELYYTNNISSFKNFAFRITASPLLSVLQPGDTIQLNAIAGPNAVVSSYEWANNTNLSCTQCKSPVYVADTTTTKTVSASSTYSCTDTTTIAIQVPPYNDFSININDLQCAGGDSLHVDFTLLNSFIRPKLPKTLSVSFYSGDPTKSTAVLLPPVYSLRTTVNNGQATFTTSIKAPTGGGKVYAVVNDSGKVLPVVFPNTMLLEKLYTNNFDDTTYFPDSIIVLPADTTVFRKQSFPLKMATTIYNAATTRWFTGNNYTLSCTNCPGPVVTVLDNAKIQVETANRYGCIIKGSSVVHIYPADMQVRVNSAKCVSNNNTEVSFTICMNNNYDSVFAGIPVSFYDANPDSGVAHLLHPVFYTPATVSGNCHSYTTNILTTTTQKIFAVVNDDGSNATTVPNKVYDETNYNNNIHDTAYIPFRVSVVPADTSIKRLASIRLVPTSQGGAITSYSWEPPMFLSCTTCPTPIATPRYTTQYILTAKNATNCTDTALVIIRTHTPDGVYIPDAFTPNNDGLNDIFYVLGGTDVTVIKDFSIYSRWGQKVFEKKNVIPNTPVHGWDGRVNGKEAETATYVYSVNIQLANGLEKLYKGTVILIK